MKFILRKDVPTLAKGETGICIDSFSIITHTQFEGLREQSLKDIKSIPVEILEELRNFLNETYADIKQYFIVRFITNSSTTPVGVPKNTKVATMSIASQVGYTSAWQLDGVNYDFDTPVTSDLSLIATYTPIDYTITYNLNGGVEETNPASYNILTPTIIFAAPTREGYTFDGWFGNAEFTDSAITELPLGSTGNVELWAKWTEIVVEG